MSNTQKAVDETCDYAKKIHLFHNELQNIGDNVKPILPQTIKIKNIYKKIFIDNPFTSEQAPSLKDKTPSAEQYLIDQFGDEEQFLLYSQEFPIYNTLIKYLESYAQLREEQARKEWGKELLASLKEDDSIPSIVLFKIIKFLNHGK